jgi:hypothetical protein
MRLPSVTSSADVVEMMDHLVRRSQRLGRRGPDVSVAPDSGAGPSRGGAEAQRFDASLDCSARS